MKKYATGLLVCFLFLAAVLAGCGKKSEATGSAEPAASETATSELAAAEEKPAAGELQKVKLIEAWYAKGEDGGYFAALQQGYYHDSGVDMTIQPGGPQISAMQLVASGKADFGISYADDILKAREQGIPVVGLLAAFQYTPQVLISHEDDVITNFKDLEGRTIFLTPGALYWEFIKYQYGLQNVKEVSYTGQLVNFINTPKSLNQGYITNEPYALSLQGIKVNTLKVADSGYANYADVLFTTEDYLKEHPDIVKAVVQASQKGWSYYLDNYKEVNPFIQPYNPDMSVEAMDYEAEHEKEFILTEETKENGIGYMTLERWNKVQDQLLALQALKEKQDVSKAFTTGFLSKP